MIDPTNFEKECMKKTLRPLGEYITEIGIDKAFKDLTREQVLQMIEVIVTAYHLALSDLDLSDEVPF